MSTTTEKLTKSEARRYARKRDAYYQEADDLDRAGLPEDAAKVRAKGDRFDALLEADREARQEEESRRWAEKRRQREAQEAREKAEEEGREKAVAFLETLRLPIEVEELLTLAERKGIARHHLVAAANELGLRQLRWMKSGTATLPDRSKPALWGKPMGPARVIWGRRASTRRSGGRSRQVRPGRDEGSG